MHDCFLKWERKIKKRENKERKKKTKRKKNLLIKFERGEQSSK
jgi:hypothetical protein